MGLTGYLKAKSHCHDFFRRNATNPDLWQEKLRTLWFVVVRSGSAKNRCLSQRSMKSAVEQRMFSNVQNCAVRRFVFFLIHSSSFLFVAIRWTSYCIIAAIVAFRCGSGYHFCDDKCSCYFSWNKSKYSSKHIKMSIQFPVFFFKLMTKWPFAPCHCFGWMLTSTRPIKSLQ